MRASVLEGERTRLAGRHGEFGFEPRLLAPDFDIALRTGDNLFTRESGAVAAQFHDPPAIEPYASELVALGVAG